MQEGNKRVSVLKSYNAPTITGHVVRILPADSDDEEVQAYYAFLRFYRLAKIYQVRFRQPESYARLQAALGFEPDHVWTDAERSAFLAGFYRFREAYLKGGGRELSATTAAALLVWLRVYAFPQLREMSAAELTKSLEAVMMDDFGSGYSSLNNLKDIPIDVLKIDLKFLSGGGSAGRRECIMRKKLKEETEAEVPEST